MVDRSLGQSPSAGESVPAPSERRRRVEIVHESLLREWPRLVRWQTQDEEGAQLRDQLRQTAQLWEERGRPEDLLWTDTSFKEYELWRERYTGGLSAVEERFAGAMSEHASRRRRRRRVAVGALIVGLTIGLTVLAVLWQRSETARAQALAAEQQARDDARRAEAANLLSLGRPRLETHPTAALAHALASLERIDNDAARRFAVEALWHGPVASLVTESKRVNGSLPIWSPDGRWLAIGGTAGLVVQSRNGDEYHHLENDRLVLPEGFSAGGSRLLARAEQAERFEYLAWAVPTFDRLGQWWLPRPARPYLFDSRLLLVEPRLPGEPESGFVLRERALETGSERTLGPWPLPFKAGAAADPTGTWFTSLVDGRLLRARVDALDSPPRNLGHHEGDAWVWARPWDDRIVTATEFGEIEIWNAETGERERSLRSGADARRIALDPSGRFLVSGPPGTLTSESIHLFDLEAPSDARPTILRYDEVDYLNAMSVSPREPLLATGHYPHGTLVWNLSGPRSMVLSGQEGETKAIAFTPDGHLVSTSSEGLVSLWSLSSAPDQTVRRLLSTPSSPDLAALAVSRDGRLAVVARENAAEIFVLPLDGSPISRHDLGDEDQGFPTEISLSPDGRKVAMGYLVFGKPEAASIRVLDLETGEVQILRPDDVTDACVTNSPSLGPGGAPYWMSDGRLISEGALGLRLWNLDDGSSRQLRPCRDGLQPVGATPDSRTVITVTDPVGFAEGGRSVVLAFDLETSTTRTVASHGNRVSAFALDSSGDILVTGDKEGLVRVGPLSGAEPHLLYGHTGRVSRIAVSPDGRWIVTASDDGLRVWPMPDLSRPPLHTLPHDELLAKLRSLTNLRVVEDPDSATGYSLEPGPYPGWEPYSAWEEVPEW